MERKTASSIKKKDEGAELVEWLSARFTYFSAEAWEGCIARGELTVNGEWTAADRRLIEGDLVAFDPPDAEEPPADESFSLILERPEFLVVAKPPNLPCHPGGRYFKRTLWRLLREAYGPVHFVGRLDRETSGLVLAARNAEEAARLQGLQSAGLIEKSYLALVHGAFPDSDGGKGFLFADASSAIRKKRRFARALPPDAAAPHPGIAPAATAGVTDRALPPAIPAAAGAPGPSAAEACETRFALVGRSDRFSLVRAILVTGRTHQIRATLLSLGYPIVGDKLYGLDEGFFLRFITGSLSAADRGALVLDHQALHAERLSFPDRDGKIVRVSAPCPFGLI